MARQNSMACVADLAVSKASACFWAAQLGAALLSGQLRLATKVLATAVQGSGLPKRSLPPPSRRRRTLPTKPSIACVQSALLLALGLLPPLEGNHWIVCRSRWQCLAMFKSLGFGLLLWHASNGLEPGGIAPSTAAAAGGGNMAVTLAALLGEVGARQGLCRKALGTPLPRVHP